jgi:predicted lipid-binding transport protein (Tim44 family)
MTRNSGSRKFGSRKFGRLAMAAFVGIITLGMSADYVDAKPGRGASSGSRGSRSDTSVPSTPTAPRTSPSAPSSPAAIPSRPGAAQTAAVAAPSRMSTMAKGFAAGLIGAGLFGLLSGGSLFGGLSGMMGFLGLLLQIALIAVVARLIWGFFRNRQAAPQTAGTQYNRSPEPDLSRIGLGQAGNGQAAGGQASVAPQANIPQRSDTVGIGPADYEAFNGVLTNVMAAYSNEDLAGLRRVAMPDVAAGFIRELHENQTAGTINVLGAPHLLQGDLAEAWYEDSTAYASVAIRYTMTDVMRRRSDGQIVSGSADQPQESVEIWTFRRDGAGKPWMLAGQQQA